MAGILFQNLEAEYRSPGGFR